MIWVVNCIYTSIIDPAKPNEPRGLIGSCLVKAKGISSVVGRIYDFISLSVCQDEKLFS
jgi:hypothetical protein